MKYYIMVFKNTHDAMAAEKILEEKAYSFRIMPTPTSITHSCGICVRFENLEQLIKAKEEDFDYKNSYLREGNSYKEI